MARPLKIGITCYASVGGSGVLAAALGESLAARGHEVHFIGSERPFRLPEQAQRIHFHPVAINNYELFRYPDYTLPLSVKMAEVTRDVGLDILHVHYAVPHATAAILARSMLPESLRPRVVTTLHGTDTTLLGRDPAFGPAIRFALEQSDAVTAVSEFLKCETIEHLNMRREIEVIHNFFSPGKPARPRVEVRAELGVTDDQVLLLHSSNLRALKRIDLLLAAMAAVKSPRPCKLLILAGEDFAPFQEQVRQLGLEDRVMIRDKVRDIEEYLAAADLNLVTSESESFCLSILEAMCFACPSVAMSVGGIPEVIDDRQTGSLVPFGDVAGFAREVERLIEDSALRANLGRRAQVVAGDRFSAEAIVPRYELLYQSICSSTAP